MIKIQIKKTPKKNKINVLDLFGGSNHSVAKALNNRKYNIITVDLFHLQDETDWSYKNELVDIDLSTPKGAEKLIKYLHKLGIDKFDIITASPPCTTFSIASAITIYGNSYYKYKTNSKLTIPSKDEYEKWTGKLWTQEKTITRYKNENCLKNTIKLIKHYTPKNWYIENPKTSKMWQFIKYNLKNSIKGKSNDTYYNNYGFPIPKATKFLSNQKLILKNKKIKSKINWNKFKDNNKQNQRSLIPSKLILDIFNQFDKKN